VRTEPPPPPPPTSRLRLAGIVVGATGLATLVTGLAFGLKARSAGQSDSTRTMFDPSADDSGHSYETLQYVGYAVGGALLAGGVTMYILSGRGRAAEPATAVAFTPTPSGGIGMLRTEF
jgi:hypothetical protein